MAQSLEQTDRQLRGEITEQCKVNSAKCMSTHPQPTGPGPGRNMCQQDPSVLTGSQEAEEGI